MGLDISKVEEKYGVKYIGFYDLPDGRENVYIFYQPNPKTELGHSNYLGVFINYLTSEIWLTDGKSILDAKYPARKCEDGFILCSRYRHDYVVHGDHMLDGGLAYTRCSGGGPNGFVQIIDDKEVFVEYQRESEIQL